MRKKKTNVIFIYHRTVSIVYSIPFSLTISILLSHFSLLFSLTLFNEKEKTLNFILRSKLPNVQIKLSIKLLPFFLNFSFPPSLHHHHHQWTTFYFYYWQLFNYFLIDFFLLLFGLYWAPSCFFFTVFLSFYPTFAFFPSFSFFFIWLAHIFLISQTFVVAFFSYLKSMEHIFNSWIYRRCV